MKKAIFIIIGMILSSILCIAQTEIKAFQEINSNKHEFASVFRVLASKKGNLLTNKTELWFTQSVGDKSRSKKIFKALYIGNKFQSIEEVSDPVNLKIMDSNVVVLNGTASFPYCQDCGIFTSNRLDGSTDKDNDLYTMDDCYREIKVSREANVNSDYWDDDPNISPDGKLLYFSSDRLNPGSGLTDIFISHKSSKGWSVPTVLSGINHTEYSEQTPFCGPDGYLYYSTNQTKSGNYDIWRVRINSDGEPEGSPESNPVKGINTDDFDETHPVISQAGNWFIFSSNKGPKGKKDFDLYFIKNDEIINSLKEESIDLTVRVLTRNYDTDFQTFIDAVNKVKTKINVRDLTTNRIFEFYSDDEGFITMKFPHSSGDHPINDDRIRKLEIRAVPPSPNFFSPTDTIYYDIFCKTKMEYNLTLIDTLIYNDPKCEFDFKVTRVPFFITGYWCPTTVKYKNKVPCQSYFGSKDCEDFKYEKPVVPCSNNDIYQYKLDFTPPKLTPVRNSGLCLDEKEAQQHARDYASKVDSSIDKFVEIMANALKHRCVETALNNGDIVNVEVIGWTDMRGFKEASCLYTGNDIDFKENSQLAMRDWEKKGYLENGILKNGTSFRKSRFAGNEMLSDLRAYNTAKLLDLLWLENIPAYRIAKSKGSIKLYSEGKGIDKSTPGGMEIKRAVDVRLIVPVQEGKKHDAFKPDSGRTVVICSEFENPCIGQVTYANYSKVIDNNESTTKTNQTKMNEIVKTEVDLPANDCSCKENDRCWHLLVFTTSDKNEALNTANILNSSFNFKAEIRENEKSNNKYKIEIGCWNNEADAKKAKEVLKNLDLFRNYKLEIFN